MMISLLDKRLTSRKVSSSSSSRFNDHLIHISFQFFQQTDGVVMRWSELSNTTETFLQVH